MMRIIAFVLLACGLTASAAEKPDYSSDRQRVDAIFAAHDRMKTGLDEYLKSVADDVILMPDDGLVVEGKAAYRQEIVNILAAGDMKIRHEAIAVYSYPEIVIARGRATGTFVPNGQTAVSTFETKNVFIFRRLGNGELQVWQIIFNHNPEKPPGQ